MNIDIVLNNGERHHFNTDAKDIPGIVRDLMAQTETAPIQARNAIVLSLALQLSEEAHTELAIAKEGMDRDLSAHDAQIANLVAHVANIERTHLGLPADKIIQP
jgi:hypothetical protein